MPDAPHVFMFSGTALPNDQTHPIQVLHTARALACKGARVSLRVIVLEAPADAIWRHYGMEPPKGVDIKAMVPRWYHRLRGMGLDIDPQRYAVYRWARARLGRELRRAVRRGPTLVYTRNEKALRLIAPAAQSAGAPVYMELHWLKYIDRFRKFLDRHHSTTGAAPPLSLCKDTLRRAIGAERETLALADGVLCLTEPLRRIVARWALPGRLTVLPSGVEVEDFDASGAERDIDILYVGQLYPWKGVDTLVEALAQLPDRILTVVGGNRAKDRKRLRRQAEALGVADRIDWVDPVPHGEVALFMRRARVGVVPLPRAGYAEARFFTSPMKVFEFAAAGVPIVASDLPSLRDVLAHGENAWLVRPDDADALAQGLQTLLENENLRQRLGAGGRDLARSHSFAGRAQRILDFCTTSESHGLAR